LLPESARRVRQKIGLLLTCAATGLSLGCQNEGLSSIDRRVDQLIRERSGILGKDALVPEYGGIHEANEASDRSPTDKQPESRNPDTQDLNFKPRSPEPDARAEAGQIEERLGSFQAVPTTDQGGRLMALTDVLKQAQLTSREYITLEEDYILAAIRLLVQRHDWSPQFFNTTSAAFGNVQVDGDTTSSAVNVINELKATQRLPYGGQAEARWVYNATENLRSAATGQYRQGSEIILDGNVPLLRGAGLIAQEGLIQAERDLIYAARTFEDRRRKFFVDISRDFFALQQQALAIENTARRLESVQLQLDRENALFQAGRSPEFEVNRAEFELLRSKRDLATQRETYVLAIDRFKVRLGLPESDRVVVGPRDAGVSIPMPDISLEQAVALALDYRLDLQNQRDQLDDRRRAVANARNQLLPDLNVGGSVHFPTDADAREGGAVFEPDDVTYGASVNFGLPLDREVERLNLRSTQIGLEQAVRGFDQFRDELILDVRGRVRNIEVARYSLLLAERSVEITKRRQEEQDLKADEVTPRERLDTTTDLLNAENERDQNATDLRNSVLDYLLATGQMRVDRDGVFRRLPGMPPVAGGSGQP
jgi:outer membrane protein TolC